LELLFGRPHTIRAVIIASHPHIELAGAGSV
jgi:hypothetical protein